MDGYTLKKKKLINFIVYTKSNLKLVSQSFFKFITLVSISKYCEKICFYHEKISALKLYYNTIVSGISSYARILYLFKNIYLQNDIGFLILFLEFSLY